MAKLTNAQIAQFDEEGYLAIEDVLNPQQDLDPVIEEYSVILDRLSRELYERDEISSLYTDLPFAKRLTQIQYQSGKSYSQHFDIALPKRNVAEDTPVSVGPAIFSLLRNAKLLDAVESLIGGEIYANPDSTRAAEATRTPLGKPECTNHLASGQCLHDAGGR